MQEPEQLDNEALNNPVEKMLDAERDVQARLGDRPIDFEANRAISNIYRAAASVRRQAERGLLKDFGLSWGGFTIWPRARSQACSRRWRSAIS
jgi:hypothetical protein